MIALRFLASSQIAGGVFLLFAIPFTWHMSNIPMWYQMASLTVGLYAIFAGTFLWITRRLGQWLSLLLQVIQLVQLSTGTFVLKILVGFYLSVFIFQAGGLNVSPGFAGSLGVGGMGHIQPPGLGINLLAMLSIGLLVISLTWSLGANSVPKQAVTPWPKAI